MFLVRDADVVIAIGGGRKTYEGALAALVVNKTLILIGSFGGAGQEILHSVKSIKGCHYNIDVTQLENTWDSNVLQNILVQSGIVESKIFIVHGHDIEAKEQLAKILTDYGLIPIILHEQPDVGRTLIEKFEEESSNIRYAFILLTPDDKITRSVICQDTNQIQKTRHNRARQNVVFEMGYFIGKLGRDRVCCIQRNVELPSDIHGLVYRLIRNH